MCDINEIKEAIDELKEKLDDLCDSIEDTVESAVQDAVEDAVEGAVEGAVQDAVDDAMQNIDMGGAGGAVMYVLSQDGKHLVPFVSAQAYRIKKGEEPYAISVSGGNMQTRVGKYENKAAALAEMRNIMAALRNREDIYEIK